MAKKGKKQKRPPPIDLQNQVVPEYNRREQISLQNQPHGFKFINYWTDLESKDIPIVLDKHLYFKNWPESRRFPCRELPLMYCTGPRYIKLTQAPPHHFLYNDKPIDLIRARVISGYKPPKKKGQKGKGKKK